MPVIVTRASNNYGPYQFPEKVIPLFVTNAIDDMPVPLYGDGRNVRDWLHVDDHCRALDLLIERGADGEVYNIGGGNEVTNVDLTHQHPRRSSAGRASLIQPVPIGPGHDRRYCARHDEAARARLGAAGAVRRRARARPSTGTAQNEWWWRPIKEQDPAFRAYYEAQYGRER